MLREKIDRVWELLGEGLSLRKYIYYNYLCAKVKRKNGGRLLPYKGAIINLKKGSKIIVDGGSIVIGFNRLKGSKAETHLRLEKNSTWYCKKGALLFFGTFLDIKKSANFDSGFFSANTGCSIVVHKKMVFGNDVMLGRNVLIYDSDFHQLRDKSGNPINPPNPVIIEDHVWLTSNITVLKGVRIGKDSLVAAQTVINKDVPPCSIVAGKSSGTVIKDYVNWDRGMCPME